jgi:hypothetical protein
MCLALIFQLPAVSRLLFAETAALRFHTPPAAGEKSSFQQDRFTPIPAYRPLQTHAGNHVPDGSPTPSIFQRMNENTWCGFLE